ncbi:MAG: PLP-dependent aminotransferase family protein [Thermoprotei archaeon]
MHFTPSSMRVKRSPIERISTFISKDTINLAGGSPDPSLIPVDKLREVYIQVIEEYGPKAFFYPGAGGLEELVDQLNRWCAQLDIGEGELVVTSGAQHAITQICASLLTPQDKFLHENPTFVETMNSFLFYSGRGEPVPIDDQGLRTDLLEAKLKADKSHPKLLYTIPTAHNPSGVTMSEERRKHLIELAQRYNFTIIEDDPYRPISKPTRTLYSMSPENVIYVGSLSKALAPGLRIGFTLTPSHALAEKLRDLEQMDFSTSTINQLVAARILETGVIQAKLSSIREHYAAKMRIMLDCLAEHGLQPVYQPHDGFFLLLNVETDVESLLLRAVKEGVVFVPASEFFFDDSNNATIRLSVGPVDKSLIHKGINRLSQALGAKE